MGGALTAKNSFLSSDSQSLRNCLSSVQEVLKRPDATEYAVFFAFLKTWHIELHSIQTNTNAGLLVQMLSVALIVTEDQLKYYFYQDFYEAVNHALRGSGSNSVIDAGAKTAEHGDTVELVYTVGQQANRIPLLTVIKDGAMKYDDGDANPLDDAEAEAEANITGNKPINKRVARGLLTKINDFRAENQRLKKIIKDLKDIVDGLRPPVPLNLPAGGCGTLEHVRAILKPMQDHISGIAPGGVAPVGVAVAGANNSFDYHERAAAKRGRTYDYPPDAATTTAPLFRMQPRR